MLLNLTLRNGGDATAEQVQVELLSLAPGLTVNQGSESFGEIESHTEAAATAERPTID